MSINLRKMFKKEDDFILVQKNAIRKEECKFIRDWFDESEHLHRQGIVGLDSKDVIDPSIKESIDIPLNIFDPNAITSIISDPLNDAFSIYQSKYTVLQEMSDWSVSEYYNIQKYNANGGYKVLHFESSGPPICNRILVWMFYLNTIKNGGTEFPYINRKIHAEEGTLLLWPAGFTHSHKGVITNKTKYIITGWAEIL